MINKSTIVNVIDCYNLDKQVETAKWVVKDNKLTIDFMTPTRDCIGKVEYNNFNLEDCELGIHNTSQLSKLIRITIGDLLVDVDRRNGIPTKILISDQSFNLAYTLGDPVLFDTVGQVKDPGNYQATIELIDEDIDNFIKGNEAIADNDNVLISTSKDISDQKVVSFSFGVNSSHTNKVEYNMICDWVGDITDIPFNSKLIQTILKANKRSEIATININNEGLMKIEFHNENLKTTYYVLRKG